MNNRMQIIRQGKPEDLECLQYFLLENKLRHSIEINSNSLYYYIKHDDCIIGSIGAEFNRQYGLIRAAGIAKEWRRQGLAEKLFQKLSFELESKGIHHLYLFSRQAADFWTKMGFTQCAVEDIIDVLSETPQVKEFIADNTIWTDVAWHKSIIKKNK